MNHNRRASPSLSDDDDDDRPLSTYIRGNKNVESRPLIQQVTNAWASEKHQSRHPTDDTDDESDDEDKELVHCCDIDTEESFVGALASITKTRRFRRGMLFLVLIVSAMYFGYRWFLKPSWDVERILTKSFNQPLGTFGLQDPFRFKDIIQTKELESEYIPGGEHDPDGKRRLIFVGDIHGCKKELLDLMNKVGFDKETDHLICTGDVISKGPDSLGVIDTLISMNASSVRGNHEDKVLLVGDRTSENSGLDKATRKKKAAGLKGEQLASYLHHYQLKWLRSLPLILRIPAPNPPSAQAPPPQDPQTEQDSETETEAKKGKKKNKNKQPHIPDITSEINVVHAGLVPGVPLARQDPYSVMNMRSMSPSSHVPSSDRFKGVAWEQIWGWFNDRLHKHNNPKHSSPFAEDYVSPLENDDDDSPAAPTGWFGRWFGGHRGAAVGKMRLEVPSVVIYGHDSPRGLNLHRWSKGLDSGCVRGGRLTALVLDAWGRAHLVQTKCKSYY